MSVYNGGSFLKESVKSILDQNFEDLEFLIVNDGSTDNSSTIINNLISGDHRVIHHDFKDNTGYVERLNFALDHSKGQYVARMDQDDISDLNRLSCQVAFLDQNPEYVMCGTWYRNIGKLRGIAQLPVADQDIRLDLTRTNPFCHPTVMIRRAILKENGLYYSKELVPAEDYKMWVDLACHGKLANIPQYLLSYRTHNSNAGKGRTIDQIRIRLSVQADYIRGYLAGVSLNSNEYQLLARLLYGVYELNHKSLPELIDLLRGIVVQIGNSPEGDHNRFIAELGQTFFDLCTINTRLGLRLFVVYMTTPLPKPAFYLLARFFLKSLLRYQKPKHEN